MTSAFELTGIRDSSGERRDSPAEVSGGWRPREQDGQGIEPLVGGEGKGKNTNFYQKA